MSQFIPSPEQQAIFDAVLKTSDNIAIAALAGTGKTTSLVELSRRLPAGGSRIFCAFNKDIVKELESRLNGTGVTTRTFHSIGLGALKKHLNVQELPPQADKYDVLVTEWATDNNEFSALLNEAVSSYEFYEGREKLHNLHKATLAMFVKLLNFVRLKLVAWDDINALDALVAENALDADMEYDGHNDGILELVLSSVDTLMKKAEAQTRKLIIDYTDMIYWAVKWNARFFQYQWVLVDECQDLSPLQREMIAKIVSPRGGRIVLVGDPNQAIYAFAGADSNSFSLSVERWNCKVLPLTMTRRCASIITHHASLLVPSFRCPDDKARGKVVWLPEETLHKHACIGDMVLSRVKAPLVKACLSLIAEGIPATILGADIGKQLVAMLEKITKRSSYTFPRLLEEIVAYRNEQVDRAMQKGDEARAEAIRDTVNALKFVVEAYPNAIDIQAISHKITSLFADNKPADSVVTLATIHKSKGLEANRVFVLAPDKIPLRAKNMTAEQSQQEINLDYVLRTRAKNEIVYMTNEKFLEYAVMPDYVQEDFEEWNADKPAIIEADSVPAYPAFATYFQEIISLMGTTNVLYATNNGVKLCVSRMALGITALTITTISADEESTHIAEMPEAIELMQAFEPNLNHWMSISVDEWEAIRNPVSVVDAVFKPDGMFIEAFSTPDDVPVTFTAEITELIHALPPNSGLFAVDGDTKMFVAPHIMERGKYFVETVNGTYTQEVMTLDEALAKMEAFSPVVPTWNELTCDHWMHATSTQKTVAERRAEKLAEAKAGDIIIAPVTEPDAPQPESAGFTDTVVHQALELLTANEGMYATANSMKMFVTSLENRYVVRTIFVNGDDNNPVDTIQEALALMFEFQPDHKQWIVLSLDEWYAISSPVEPPFICRLKSLEHEDALFATYNHDTTRHIKGESVMVWYASRLDGEQYEWWHTDTDGNILNPAPDYLSRLAVLLSFDQVEPDVDKWFVIPKNAFKFIASMHKSLNLSPEGYGYFTNFGTSKMFVTPSPTPELIEPTTSKFYSVDVFGDGDTVRYGVCPLILALISMDSANSDVSKWELISDAQWIHMTQSEEPTPVVEASEPPPFAKTMHTRLNDLTQDYTPDTGLFADGEKTTMYITTDIEDNFVVYERDYANEPEMAWSRDYKTTNIVTLISKMQAINPDATQWTMTTWGEWIDRFHEDDEPADPTSDEAVDALRAVVTEMGGVITDSPQPETPITDALTISIIGKIIKLADMSDGDAEKLATKIHRHVSPLLIFTDWIKSNRARVKVAIKHALREANYADNDGIEIVSDEIADFYQSGEIPASDILELITKAEETGAVVDAILEPSFADVIKPRIQVLTPADPSSAIGLASNGANSTVFVYIGINEILVLTEKIYATGEHFVIPSNLDPILSKMERYNPNPDEWVSMSWNDWYKSAHSEPTDTPIEAPQPVADVVTTPVTPPADESTFSNGENTPSYTNGKDHSAPLPATAPDVLKSLIDQFRPLELTEITLMIQALEHVRKEKTEGVSV